MRPLQQAKLSLLAAVIFMAPLLCVRFCQLRDVVAHGTSLTGMAGMVHTHHANDGEHHTPLNELKQMVLAVTEFVPTAMLAIVVIVMALHVVPITRRLRRMALDVLTPPPRFCAV